MREQTYQQRIESLLYNSLNIDNSLGGDLYHSLRHDIRNLAKNIITSYLQNCGLDSVEPHFGFLDGIRLYVTERPFFELKPPLSFRTRDELDNPSTVGRYVFNLDDKRFDSLQELEEFVVGNLISGHDVVIQRIEKFSIIDPIIYNQRTCYVLRHKIIDWSTIVNRTDFSFLNNKKSFAPTKDISKFTFTNGNNN